MTATFFADRIHSHSLELEQILEIANGVRWAGLAGVAGALGAWLWRDKTPLVPLAVGAGGAVLLTIAGMAPYAYARSSRDLVTGAAADFRDASQVYTIAKYDQTLPFYLRRPVRLVEFSGEFEFGQAHAPELYPATRDAFLKEWREERRPVAVTSVERYEQLEKEGVPMKVLYRDPVDVVFTRPDAP